MEAGNERKNYAGVSSRRGTQMTEEAITFRRLDPLRRRLLLDPSTNDDHEKAWQLIVAGRNDATPPNKDSPLHLVHREIVKLGWTWPSPWYFSRPDAEEGLLPVAFFPNAWWEHEVREAIRLRELRAMVKRRPHLKACEHGIALDVQLSLVRWKGTEEQPALSAK